MRLRPEEALRSVSESAGGATESSPECSEAELRGNRRKKPQTPEIGVTDVVHAGATGTDTERTFSVAPFWAWAHETRYSGAHCARSGLHSGAHSGCDSTSAPSVDIPPIPIDFARHVDDYHQP